MVDTREEILSLWEKLTDEEKEKLIPKLLVETSGWRCWADSNINRSYWLEQAFKKAKLTYKGDFEIS